MFGIIVSFAFCKNFSTSVWVLNPKNSIFLLAFFSKISFLFPSPIIFNFKFISLNTSIKKLNYILNLSPKKLEKISKNAYETSKKFTWDNRAKQIIEFIKEINEKNNLSSS